MRIFLAMIFFYSYFPANAENFYTGKELLKHCENCIHSANVSSVSACAYCISNISIMHDLFVDWDYMEPKWCLAPEVTFKELTKKIMTFIYENPDSLRQYSTSLVANSLAKNYPCKK